MLLTSAFFFCFSLERAADSRLAMMRLAFLGSTVASGGGARCRPPLPLRLGGEPGLPSAMISARPLS